LHRLDLAFSRDQENKIYVQHRMLDNAKELWGWLQNGSYFYVCGDAKRMAKDVHQALISIVQTQGGMPPDAAAAYVNQTLMRTEKRYLRDVY
jgi:sulfite reductase (NADPH) flavoprotein alpha-component